MTENKKFMQIIDNKYWRDLLFKTTLVLGTVALIVWAMPRDNRANFKVEIGKPWRYADFTAPFDFPIYKSEELVKRERDSLMREFEPYYHVNKNIEVTQIRQFHQDYANGIPGVPASHIDIIDQHLHRLYSQGIMNTSEYNELRRDTSKTIRLVVDQYAHQQDILDGGCLRTTIPRPKTDRLQSCAGKV